MLREGESMEVDGGDGKTRTGSGADDRSQRQEMVEMLRVEVVT